MWARRWGGLLVALLSLAPATATQAAQCGGPEVSADPASAAPGQSVKVSGKNFGTCGGVLGGDAGIRIELVQGSKSFDLGTADAGAGGGFERTVTVPTDALPGNALLTASGSSGSASTGFMVSAAAPTSTTAPTPAPVPTTPSTALRSAATPPQSTTSTSQTTLTTIETLLPVPEESTTSSSSTSTTADRRQQLSIRNAGGDDGPPVWLVVAGAMLVAALLGGAGYLVFGRRT